MRSSTRTLRTPENYLLRQYIRESVRETNSLLVEQILIQEGLAGELKDVFRDVVKVALGAGAVVGSAGMGGDTVTDMIFAVEGSAEVIAEIESVASSASELGNAIQAAKAANIKSGPDAVYDAVLSTAQAVGGAEAGEEAMDKAKESVDGLLEKLAGSIGEWVATALPDDAGLGGIAIREAIEAVVGVVSEDVYDLLKSAFRSLPAEVQKFIADPAAMTAFLNEITDDLVALLEKAKSSSSDQGEEKGEDDEGIAAFVAKTATKAAKATPQGMMLSAAADMALPKIIDYLNKDFRQIIPEAAKILNILATVTFGVVALLQIIVREEYKEADEEAEEKAEKDSEKSVKTSQDAAKANESIHHLRLLIRHELSRNLI